MVRLGCIRPCLDDVSELADRLVEIPPIERRFAFRHVEIGRLLTLLRADQVPALLKLGRGLLLAAGPRQCEAKLIVSRSEVRFELHRRLQMLDCVLWLSLLRKGFAQYKARARVVAVNVQNLLHLLDLFVDAVVRTGGVGQRQIILRFERPWL